MDLGAGVIIGGLVKFLLEDFRERKENRSKIKEYKVELLNGLRKVFDEVELSRTLIESHKSARAYSEGMKNGVMKGNVSLLDIKRSLVDSDGLLEKESILKLRVSIHFMIAYLTALTDEYTESYLILSNKQYYLEGLKDALRKKYTAQIINAEVGELNLENIYEKYGIQHIPNKLNLDWEEEMKQFPFLTDFLKRDITVYHKCVIEHFEYCKSILKDEKSIEKLKKPKYYDVNYEVYLKEIDGKKRKGKLKKEDNLVSKIVVLIKSKIEEEEKAAHQQQVAT